MAAPRRDDKQILQTDPEEQSFLKSLVSPSIFSEEIARYLTHYDILQLGRSSKYTRRAASMNPVMDVVWTSNTKPSDVEMNSIQKQYVKLVLVRGDRSLNHVIKTIPTGTQMVEILIVRVNMDLRFFWSKIINTYTNLQVLKIIGDDVYTMEIDFDTISPLSLLPHLHTLHMITSGRRANGIVLPIIANLLPKTLTSCIFVPYLNEPEDSYSNQLTSIEDFDCSGLWPPNLTELVCPSVTLTWDNVPNLVTIGHFLSGSYHLPLNLLAYNTVDIPVEFRPNLFKDLDILPQYSDTFPSTILSIDSIIGWPFNTLPSSLTQLRIKSENEGKDISNLKSLKILHLDIVTDVDNSSRVLHNTLKTLSAPVRDIYINSDLLLQLQYLIMLPSSVESLRINSPSLPPPSSVDISIPEKLPLFINNIRKFIIDKTANQTTTSWLWISIKLMKNLQYLKAPLYEDTYGLGRALPNLLELEITYYGQVKPFGLFLNPPPNLVKLKILWNNSLLNLQMEELKILLPLLPKNLSTLVLPFKIDSQLLRLLPKNVQEPIAKFSGWTYMIDATQPYSWSVRLYEDVTWSSQFLSL